jgi:rRNA maturation protein Nop10
MEKNMDKPEKWYRNGRMCPKCLVSKNSYYCDQCGVETIESVPCVCGNKLYYTLYKFCPECGHPVVFPKNVA